MKQIIPLEMWVPAFLATFALLCSEKDCMLQEQSYVCVNKMACWSVRCHNIPQR